jgi:hypothetical protein
MVMVEEQDHPDQFVARPPGRWFHGITAVVLVAILWGDSYTGLWWPSVPLYPLLLVLCIILLVRVTRHLSSGRRGRGGGRSRMVAVLPALVALTVVIHAFDLPLALRWKLSEGAFEQAAETARSTPTDEVERRWSRRRVGVYEVDNVFRIGDDVYFREADVGFLENSGFACLPDGLDAARSRYDMPSKGAIYPELSALGGCWYAWYIVTS